MRRKLLATTVLVVGLAITPMAAALTTSFPAEGGTWYHGYGPCNAGTCTQSIYYHPRTTHNATAVGKTTVRKVAGAGSAASALAPKRWSGNQVYYGIGR